jgi:hypothetical protein
MHLIHGSKKQNKPAKSAHPSVRSRIIVKRIIMRHMISEGRIP